MKATILLLCMIISGNLAHACLAADQDRIFPLGMCDKGLAVFETHLDRSEYFDENNKHTLALDPGWGGPTFLKVYDSNLIAVHSELIDTIEMFLEADYDSIVGGAFAKAMMHAKKLPGFSAATPVSILFCDFQQQCTKASLGFDTLNNAVIVNLPGKVSAAITPSSDSLSLLSNIFGYVVGDTGMIELTAANLKNDLFISSVRQFQIGSKKLTVVHLGHGQTMNLAAGGTFPPGTEEYAASFPFKDIHATVYNEPVLHHGHGFDFFVLE